ncbi:MAG: dethiobiotin synthase [Burkholderiales bacterium]
MPPAPLAGPLPSSETKGIFVTGTDTGVGKTRVATLLLREFASRGWRVVGMKPVAAGALRTPKGLCNEDVEALTEASNVRASRDLVNPYCFEPPLAPHLAAEMAGTPIRIEIITRAYAALAARTDLVVVEGAGGLLVPLDADRDFADLAQALALPLVLVVGMRLGCLNHALLSADVANRRGLSLVAWVANTLDPDMLVFDRNLETLQHRLPMPLLGVVPYGPSDTQSKGPNWNLDLLTSRSLADH